MILRSLVVAGCLLGGSAFLSAYSRGEQVPPRQPLRNLPLSVAAWHGRELPRFEAEIERVLGVDEYVTRIYRRPEAAGVGLYIGYYQSQRHGDTIHSPLNCLPGAGWEPTTAGRATLTTGPNSPPVEVNSLIIRKGLERQAVVYWYSSHGRVVASEYWGKVYTVIDAIRYNRTDAAMIRVTVPVTSAGTAGEQAAKAEALAFSQALYPHLAGLLPL